MPELKTTYSGFIIVNMTLPEGWVRTDFHTTSDGARAVVLDERDNQEYEVLVKPIFKEEE